MKAIFTKIILSIFSILILTVFTLQAETIVSSQDGNWNVGETWVGGNTPTSADSVVVNHLVNIYTDDSCMNLYVAPSGILQNRINGSRTLVILGNLYVDGAVAYTNNYFNIKLGGNLHLNGIWDSPKVEFTGSTEQIVSAAHGKVFEATRTAIEFEDINPASPLKFATDLSFIDIALVMNSTTVEFAPGIQVALSVEELLDANIIGNNSVLMMHDGSYAQGCMLENLTFKGVFIMGNGNTASGELINADTLQNLINLSRTLEVFGNFTNNGMIRETNNHFNFIIHGDVANSGSWVSSDVSFDGDISSSNSWMSSNVYFDGASDQHVNFGSGTHIFCDNIEDRDVNSKIILDTDWEIHNANVDLNNGILEVSGHKVTLREAAFIEEAFIDEAVLGGVFNCLLNCVFTGTTTISDTLQNHGNYSTPEVVFEGNLTNNGVIRKSYSSNTYGLRIFIHTDFEVNGPVEIEDLTFAGVNNQTIFSTTKGAVIVVDDVFDTVAASSIIVNSDFTFIGSTWDLDGASINLNNGNLTMQGGNLKNGSLTTSNKYLRQSGGAAIWNMHLSNVELKGICQVFASDNLFTNVTNTDTLRNYSAYNSHVRLSADGNFVNNGVINRGNNYAIQLYIHNDFINNGPVDIEDLFFAGINDQTIYSTSKGGIIDVDQVYDTVASSAIILNSDMTFIIENFWDLDGASINMNNGSLTMQGGNLKNGSLTCNNQYLRQSGDAAILNMHLSNVELKGICQVFGSDILFTNVTNTDTLRNYPGYNSHTKLLAEGNFVNNGVINRGNNYGFQLYVYNDFIINGPIDIEDLVFAGNNDQTIYSTSKGGIIDVDQVYDTVASSAIIFNVDMTFIGSNWYLDGASINLNNGALIMQGGRLANGFLTSNNQYLRQSGNAGISEMHFSDVELKGICKLSSVNNYFTNVTVTDTLMNHQDFNTYPKLFVDGDFVNNGVITNSDNYWIDLWVDDNFYNNGKANFYKLIFTGDDIQHFYSPVFPISNSEIESTKTGGLVQCDDVVLLDTCIVYFNWDVFSLQNGDLKVTGGDLKKVGIKGNGFKLISNGNGATANVAFEDLTIEGHLHMGGIDNSFNDVTLSDTISQHEDHNYDTHITTTGDFINNGHIIDDDNYDLWFYIQDVLINNGEWTSEKLIFVGDDMHIIQSIGGRAFTVDNISHETGAGSVEVRDELMLENAILNFGGAQLFVPENGLLQLYNSTLTEVDIRCENSPVITGLSQSVIQNSQIEGAIIFGLFELGNQNTFSNCIIDAELMNDNINQSVTLEIADECSNNGFILNQPDWLYNLYLNFRGNLIHNGDIECEEARWKGIIDQDIYLLDGNIINTLCEFYPMLGTGGYQWYKNGNLITGETTEILDFPEITAAERGYYHCETNEGSSRTIRICTPLDVNLAAEAWFCQYQTVMLEPEVSSGTEPYTYSWLPAEGLSDPTIQNPLANPEESTVYTISITDAVGCVGESTVFVQQYSTLNASAGSDKEICFSQSIVLIGSASGGTPEYSYQWAPATGLNNPDIATPFASPQETTLYTFTVTDANGCEETAQVNVVVNPLPLQFGLSQDSTHFCYENDTIICWLLDSEIGVQYELFVNASPNPGGEIFAGTGEAIPIWATTTVMGHYELRGTNTTTLCENMMLGSVMIFIDFLPEVVNQSSDETLIDGESTSLWVEVTSTQPPWLQWYKDDVLIPGAENHTLLLENVSTDATGIYQCLVTNDCDFVWSDPISIAVVQRQTVEIPAGWSGFSTYMEVYDPEVTNMFDQLGDKLIIVNNFENMYWPDGAVNTYGNWNTQSGAQIKLTENATLKVDGYDTEDLTLSLDPGWHYLPVLSPCNLDASEVFNSLGNNLDLVKDIAGIRVFWPEYNIQSLNLLEPGKAYLIKLNSTTEVSFPACLKGSNFAPTPPRPINGSPWPDPAYTATSHLIVITRSVATDKINPGDWVGVFNASGVCSGLACYKNKNLVISAFANDVTGSGLDGLNENESMYLKVFKPSSGETTELSIQYKPKTDGSDFKANGISVAAHLNSTPTTTAIVSVFPNPTQNVANIKGLEPGTTYEIMNSSGLIAGHGSLNRDMQIELGRFPAGLYTLKFISNSGIICKKVLLQ